MGESPQLTISIGEAAKRLGISVKTLRRWADAHKIRSLRSPSGHRRFYVADIQGITPRILNTLHEGITINYARVSSHEHHEYLKKQIQMLELFSSTNGWQYETISDLGSGVNYHNRGLRKLLKRIMQGDVSRLVITHRDRLLRIGAELVFTVCEEFETEVVIMNKSDGEVIFEELANDVAELLTVFSASLYADKPYKSDKYIQNSEQLIETIYQVLANFYQ